MKTCHAYLLRGESCALGAAQIQTREEKSEEFLMFFFLSSLNKCSYVMYSRRSWSGIFSCSRSKFHMAFQQSNYAKETVHVGQNVNRWENCTSLHKFAVFNGTKFMMPPQKQIWRHKILYDRIFRFAWWLKFMYRKSSDCLFNGSALTKI